MNLPINRLDLNLLRVFDAVMEEKSVLKAGQRICLSQSAVSHALARLRGALDDELFMRTPTGMRPTARALMMAPLIRAAWKSLEAAMGPPKFDPSNSTKRFTIVMSDFVAMVVVPDLLNLLKREAPLVDLVIRSDCRMDLVEQIDLGQIDAVLGIFSQVPTRFRSNLLFPCDDVLIVNSSRKLGGLSLERLSHLSIATVCLHGEHEGIVDGFVSERGLARRSEMYDRAAFERAFSELQRSPRMAVSLPHFLALPYLLKDRHLTAIVPRPLAKSLARTHALSMHELPYRTSPAAVQVVSHKRNAHDGAQEWLLAMLERSTGPLRAQEIGSTSQAQCESNTGILQ